MLKGMRAAIGMLRPKMMSGDRNAATGEKQPARIPSGTATATAKQNPRHTRFNVIAVLAISPRSDHSFGKLVKVSCGLGRLMGLTTRSSASP